MALQTAAEMDMRVRRVAELLSTGGKRSDCVRFAADEWGIKSRMTDELIARARVLIREDWESVHREQMMAEILSQYSSLQLEAREKGQLHVALGCIHGAAKVAQLVQ